MTLESTPVSPAPSGGGWMRSRDPRIDTRVDRTRETEKHWKRTREGSAGVAGVVGGRGGRGGSRPVVQRRGASPGARVAPARSSLGMGARGWGRRYGDDLERARAWMLKIG